MTNVIGLHSGHYNKGEAYASPFSVLRSTIYI